MWTQSEENRQATLTWEIVAIERFYTRDSTAYYCNYRIIFTVRTLEVVIEVWSNSMGDRTVCALTSHWSYLPLRGDDPYQSVFIKQDPTFETLYRELVAFWGMGMSGWIMTSPNLANIVMTRLCSKATVKAKLLCFRSKYERKMKSQRATRTGTWLRTEYSVLPHRCVLRVEQRTWMDTNENDLMSIDKALLVRLGRRTEDRPSHLVARWSVAGGSKNSWVMAR